MVCSFDILYFIQYSLTLSIITEVIFMASHLGWIFDMKWTAVVLAAIFLAISANGNLTIFDQEDTEELRSNFLAQLIKLNLKNNGWSNIIVAGELFPDSFYRKIKRIPYTTLTNIHVEKNDTYFENVVPYHTNILIMQCADIEEFEQTFRKVMGSPYWHPHANTILYYHQKGQEDIPKIFMIFWFYRSPNVILMQYDDSEKAMIVTRYDVYISEHYKLSRQFGCWKSSKIGRIVRKFTDSFKCEDGCHNATLLNSAIRTEHLGTCVGIETVKMKYDDVVGLKLINFFEDKGKNLHGYIMAGRSATVLPFLTIKKDNNGGYIVGERDGMIWNTFAELMNFTMDFSASASYLEKPFNFEINVGEIFSFARRKADLVCFPVYQFDLLVVDMDFSIPYKDSGVCILSHRAGYETTLFDVKLLQENIDLVIQFTFCILSIWMAFFIFNATEKKILSFDQAGKDLMNAIRNILSLNLHRPPKQGSFRIYLLVSMWCFFLLNFATQAAIISFFSAYKRGNDVNTFEDVVEKGYVVEGMPSPDMMLPDTEERFRKINSKLVPMTNLFECVDRMSKDPQRFCLIDCSVGRYLARNRLNEKGEQYLHIASDRFHSHYLVMVFHKHSPLTPTFNKYLRRLIEAGLVLKWEKYRFNDILSEAPVKALSLEDLIGIFKCYQFLLGLSTTVFILEMLIGLFKLTRKHLNKAIWKWKKNRLAKKQLNISKELGRIERVDAFTQSDSF